MELKILYEDEHLLFCIKPPGVLSEAASSKNMVDLLSEGRAVFPVHRLDKEVGGIMVFAKNRGCAAKLSAIISQGEMNKEYLAVVCGKPEKEKDVLEDLLFKDSSKNKSFTVKRMRKGVKKASLEYEVIKTISSENQALSLIKIKLHTGRTHQIRVQFSSRKLPLLGDNKYGGKSEKCKTALWSNSLSLKHPIKKDQLSFKADPPKEYPWSLF